MTSLGPNELTDNISSFQSGHHGENSHLCTGTHCVERRIHDDIHVT